MPNDVTWQSTGPLPLRRGFARLAPALPVTLTLYHVCAPISSSTERRFFQNLDFIYLFFSPSPLAEKARRVNRL